MKKYLSFWWSFAKGEYATKPLPEDPAERMAILLNGEEDE